MLEVLVGVLYEDGVGLAFIVVDGVTGAGFAEVGGAD
jgi:hypothetical protein